LAAETGMDPATSAGDHLAQAWRAVYGRALDPREAYEQSVKAVEAACVGVVLPRDKKATLGKVIAHLRSTPGEWRVRPATGAHGIETFTAMMDLLWTGPGG
jgi:hypothetical protein